MRMFKELRVSAACAALVAAATIGGSVQAMPYVVTSPTFIDATNENGVVVSTGMFNAGDAISFKAYGTSYLQRSNSTGAPAYGTNPSGYVTVAGAGSGNGGTDTPVGGSLTDTGNLYGTSNTYGSLIAILSDGATTYTTQVFAPPSTGPFSYGGTFGSLFGLGSGGRSSSFTGSLSFRVDDFIGRPAGGSFVDGYADNSGGFTLNNAVPEMSTWAMLLVGFGGLGMSWRRKQAQRLLAV